jgi:hypothetical protein
MLHLNTKCIAVHQIGHRPAAPPPSPTDAGIQQPLCVRPSVIYCSRKPQFSVKTLLRGQTAA